jgi:hypothetical protein
LVQALALEEDLDRVPDPDQEADRVVEAQARVQVEAVETPTFFPFFTNQDNQHFICITT